MEKSSFSYLFQMKNDGDKIKIYFFINYLIPKKKLDNSKFGCEINFF
jgi:hypothetical protein